jgi:hypothetical protein
VHRLAPEDALDAFAARSATSFVRRPTMIPASSYAARGHSPASKLARLEPSPQRRSRLRRAAAGKQIVDTNVLIEFGPVNALSSAGETPVPALRQGAVSKSRIPYERHRHRPPVGQINEQCARHDANFLGVSLADVSARRAHSTLSVTTAPRVLRARALGGSPHARIYGCSRVEPAQARTSQHYPHVRREGEPAHHDLRSRTRDTGRSTEPSAFMRRVSFPVGDSMATSSRSADPP